MGFRGRHHLYLTYITLQVDEVIKGRLIGSRIVIKELGGVVGNLGLAVGDSAVYSPGEEVMTFLARRPRDDTWQTNGDWQGKWSIERSAKNPGGMAVQSYSAGMVAGNTPDQVVSGTRLFQVYKEQIRAWSSIPGGRFISARRSADFFDYTPPKAETLEDWLGAFLGCPLGRRHRIRRR